MQIVHRDHELLSTQLRPSALRTRVDAGTDSGVAADGSIAKDVPSIDAAVDGARRTDVAGLDAPTFDVAVFDAGAAAEAGGTIDSKAALDGGALACTLFLGGPPLPEFAGLQGSVEIGDLDSDGIADLAATIPGANLLSVVFGQGGGVFGQHVDYPTGKVPRALRLADLDGDGDLDAVVVNETDASLSVFLNQGRGVLAAKVDLATQQPPLSVEVGDVNGDGQPDLATSASDSISLFLNLGGGRFGERQDVISRGRIQPYPYGDSIAFGDFNRDGRDDLVVSGNVTSVLFGQADGTLGAPTQYAQQSSKLAVGDLNRDGFPDIAATTRSVTWPRPSTF
jgi:hypothetical protein